MNDIFEKRCFNKVSNPNEPNPILLLSTHAIVFDIHMKTQITLFTSFRTLLSLIEFNTSNHGLFVDLNGSEEKVLLPLIDSELKR